MTTPVQAPAAPALEAPAKNDTAPPELFAALLTACATPPPLPTPPPLHVGPSTGSAPDTHGVLGADPAQATSPAGLGATGMAVAVTPAAWSSAAGVSAAGQNADLTPVPPEPAPAAPPLTGRLHPAHPEHPVHPVHPEHPVHPVHAEHPVHPPVEELVAPGPVGSTTTPDQAPPPEIAPSADPAPPLLPEIPPGQAATAQTTTAPTTASPSSGASEPTAGVRPAVAAAARRLTQEGGRTSLVVRLDPPELGAVLVRMTVRDGQVDISLRAPDAGAQGSLLAQTADIQQVLREAGLDLSSYEVSYDDLLGGGHFDEPRQTPDRGTPQRSATADGSASVTDDAAAAQPSGSWL